VNAELARISAAARQASRAGDWAAVAAGARQILKLNPHSPEGWFLTGLEQKTAGKSQAAVAAFTRALQLDSGRYDAAVELAELYWQGLRHGEARRLLESCEPLLGNSPLYLDRAATVWTRLGLHARAWPLYRRANELQPGVDKLQANLAACTVLLGHLDEAKALYRELLERRPDHQRHHYELARLERARDRAHIDRMLAVLERRRLPPEDNIFLYYAIAKELEDLGAWQESFEYYQRGGDAAAGVAHAAGYEVDRDIALIDRIVEVCDGDWLSAGCVAAARHGEAPVPIFVVGLPRTGTTLTERIIASHSRVETADETFFLQIAIKRASGVRSSDDMSPAIIEAAAKKHIRRIASGYLEAIAYRLEGRPMFIDKYPFNYLYLGFIAKAFPQARIVLLRRHPMDACFAMYKQSFFRFAFRLDDLGRYYVAWDRLRRHWADVLGERLIEVGYESLVADPEARTRELLDRLGLDFEPACLDFHLNAAPSATASAAQVRERVHTRSVGKWLNFRRQLEPLRLRLEAAGIAVD
jgi:tetratricopeptide (TPR) repeat protein